MRTAKPFRPYTTTELNALVRRKAKQHKIRCGDHIFEDRWNQIINQLDRLEPDWRGYPVPQTTGKNWSETNGWVA